MIQPPQEEAKRPRGRPFPKGTSGNPGGRPKVAADVRELARVHAADALATLGAIAADPAQDPRARIAACVALLDRAYGRPSVAIEVPPPPEPVVYQFVTPMSCPDPSAHPA